jgi:hypothetical protein
MSTFPSCGANKNTGLRIVLWCVGIGVVGLVGLPIMMVVLLAAIAAVGSNANSEFDIDQTTSPVTQVSQPAEDSVLGYRVNRTAVAYREF